MLAYGLTGGIFTLAKTSPSFHLWLVDQVEHLFGTPIGPRWDPTDLLALPSLAASYWMWTRHVRFQPEPSQRGLILIPVAALLTIANMTIRPPDNKGIDCLMLRENAVYAYATCANSGENNAYVSTDGGYSWAAASIDENDDCVPAGIRQIWDPPIPTCASDLGTTPPPSKSQQMEASHGQSNIRSNPSGRWRKSSSAIPIPAPSRFRRNRKMP